MRKLSVFLGVALTAIGSAVSAQEVESIAPLQKSSWGDANKCEGTDYIPDISLDARFGYAYDFANTSGGFLGDGLYLDINGYIAPNLSYSLNQRIASSYYEDNSGFNGTNWLTLTYEIGDFSITAGKDGVFVGSFEYDALDLDSYYDMNSSFYNNFDCWQWGVSAGWYPAEGQSILIQACNSPLAERGLAYALAWRGEMDWYESYWSTNLWQYDSGRYVKSLNLGNRFYLGDFTIDLEYMTRGADIGKMFSEDFTFLTRPSYQWDWGCAFAKFGWEKFPGEDQIEDNMFYGAGVEFFPLKENRNIRLHTAWSYNEAFIGGHFLNIGLTCKFNLTQATKRLLGKL